MKTTAIEVLQKEVCKVHGAVFLASPHSFKVGISENVRDQLEPINGLRHPPEGDTTGWYIWAGEELSDAADFFRPLHVEHLDHWCPRIQKFLGLAPGWRFLVTGEFEDVWFDDSLLEV